ncbi:MULTISPECIES: type A2 lantipeptide [Streptomyces]|uniref:Type A2 lantipeptide n=1 Tax=Streptomyces solicathayae TaxID=3081768 RepID=A0ABZ0LN68_9ACTN|nr:type A2 lantipeptide [Streptomyces sp. HUAS YS2]WOX20904.1 type A2 lantipeptide [Streptomyces sp. HUAS YS2]
MNPQIETMEISDADLDNVSGGLGGGVVAHGTLALDGIVPAVTPLVGTLVGTVEGATGLNTAPVAGLVNATIAGV